MGVVVNVLTPSVQKLLGAVRPQIYPSLAMGLLVSVIGSLFSADRMKSVMFGMEPEKIGRLLEECNATFRLWTGKTMLLANRTTGPQGRG